MDVNFYNALCKILPQSFESIAYYSKNITFKQVLCREKMQLVGEQRRFEVVISAAVFQLLLMKERLR